MDRPIAIVGVCEFVNVVMVVVVVELFKVV